MINRLPAFIRDYSLSLTLAGLFLASWLGQAVFQWIEAAQEAQTHGQTHSFSEFLAPFLAATFENWQSEFLQLLTFVVLSSFLIHRGSHESKTADEPMQQALEHIERKLDQRHDRAA
ncbi:MAG: hypothetical protein M3Q71_00180 [Chloroflexota bacterium]|nr:hypothetical protein [Chloroflexota bacterium]